MNDDRPYENLLAAIVIQAAGDFVDAYQVGLINDDNEIDVRTMQQMIYDNRKRRCRFPKWMDSTDVRTAVVFLFSGTWLEDTLPPRWDISADALRKQIVECARTGRRMSSFFCYGNK